MPARNASTLCRRANHRRGRAPQRFRPRHRSGSFPSSITMTWSSRLATSSIRCEESTIVRGLLGEVLQEPVVEQLAGHCVQPQVGLVEERQLCPRSEPDDHADGGQLPAGQFLDPPLDRKPEVLDKSLCKRLVPVPEQQPRRLEGMARREVVRILLRFADEADPRQDPVVFVRLPRRRPVPPRRWQRPAPSARTSAWSFRHRFGPAARRSGLRTG